MFQEILLQSSSDLCLFKVSLTELDDNRISVQKYLLFPQIIMYTSHLAHTAFVVWLGLEKCYPKQNPNFPCNFCNSHTIHSKTMVLFKSSVLCNIKIITVWVKFQMWIFSIFLWWWREMIRWTTILRVSLLTALGKTGCVIKHDSTWVAIWVCLLFLIIIPLSRQAFMTLVKFSILAWFCQTWKPWGNIIMLFW